MFVNFLLNWRQNAPTLPFLDDAKMHGYYVNRNLWWRYGPVKVAKGTLKGEIP